MAAAALFSKIESIHPAREPHKRTLTLGVSSVWDVRGNLGIPHRECGHSRRAKERGSERATRSRRPIRSGCSTTTQTGWSRPPPQSEALPSASASAAAALSLTSRTHSLPLTLSSPRSVGRLRWREKALSSHFKRRERERRGRTKRTSEGRKEGNGVVSEMEEHWMDIES